MTTTKDSSKGNNVMQEVLDEHRAAMERRARPPLSGSSPSKPSKGVSVEHEFDISTTYDLIKRRQEKESCNEKSSITAQVSGYINWLKHKKNPLYKNLVEPKVSDQAKQLAGAIADGLGGADLVGWGAVESPVFRRSFTVDTKRNAVVMKFFYDNKQGVLAVFDEMAEQKFEGENKQSYLLHEMLSFSSSSYDHIDEAFDDLRGFENFTMRKEQNPNDPPKVSYYAIVAATVLWEVLKHIEDHFNDNYSL